MTSAHPHDINSGADQWFENGSKAIQRRDWRYGLECLTAAVRLQPGELEYRKQKHRCSRRLHKEAGGVTRMNSVKLAAIRSRILTAQVRDDWKTVDQLAEEALSLAPMDGQMYAYIAEAAGRADWYEIAKYAWKMAIKLNRKNAAWYRSYGGLLQAHGEYEEAKKCFERIRGIDPSGRIAEELIRAVDVASLLEQGGYTAAENSRDVEIGRQQESRDSVAAVDEHQGAPVAPEPEPESKLVAFISLAEQHVRQGQLATALEAYKHARELAPENRSIQIRHEDVELAWLRGRAMDAQNGSKEHPDCSRRRATATQLLTELTARELEILSDRVARNPEDLLQAFRLADLYRRASNLHEAAPLFEKACGAPQLQTEAMIGLGECWVKTDGKAEAGRQQLEAALKTIDRSAKPNAFKLAHYWLGRLYESRGQQAAAVEHYADIVALDFHFRDVAARLESIS